MVLESNHELGRVKWQIDSSEVFRGLLSAEGAYSFVPYISHEEDRNWLNGLICKNVVFCNALKIYALVYSLLRNVNL